MDTKLPIYWMKLNIDRYDETSDPDEHIDVYVTQMDLYTSDDIIFCWVFSLLVKGTTLN